MTYSPGRLWKCSFSMTTSPRSTVPVTVACSGVFSGSGHRPSMSKYSRRSRGLRISHSARVVRAVKESLTDALRFLLQVAVDGGIAGQRLLTARRSQVFTANTNEV